MTEAELISLKERIVLLSMPVPDVEGITPQMFTPAERDFILAAINAVSTNPWSCGHTAGSVCRECYEALIARSNSLAAALHHELDESDRLRAEIKRLRGRAP